MRIAVLWTTLSGYLNACLKELASRDGVELFVGHNEFDNDAPYGEEQFEWISRRVVWPSNQGHDLLDKELATFGPEILVIAGWHIPAYRKIARLYANRCWRVMVMDNPWRSTLRQHLGAIGAPLYVRPLADAVWLPGERQAVFARKMGFHQSQILRGSFSCDQTPFENAYLSRLASAQPVPRSFLFVGRFVPEKRIETLIEAYELYRASCASPWPLVCCGAGPLGTLFEGRPGIEVIGFVQPERIASVFASNGCLVLSSQRDAWALVVHEATSAGLLVLASERVGATVHLVQPGYNGYVFDSYDAKALSRLMARVSLKDNSTLEAMSKASYELSHQYSPRRWADTLLEEFRTRSGGAGCTM